MSYESYEQIRPCVDDGVARTIEVRSDLFVDVDHAGRVLGVERIGDEVRAADLEDVIRVLVYRDEASDAAGYARAVAVLRDDERYRTWWTALPEADPAYGYWQGPVRRHLADYLEAIEGEEAS